MARVILIHWNAKEGEDRASILRKAGYECALVSTLAQDDLRAFREAAPAAFIIDLGRLPSHGRAVAVALRQQKATREIPLVFVEGDPEKVARVRELLPDAIFTDWKRILAGLKQAQRKPPAKLVVPDTMAAYSNAPLPKKLGIKPGVTVALLGAPGDLDLGSLPEGVQLQTGLRPRPNLVLLFSKSSADLERRFPAAARALAEGGGIWIAWPKQSSGLRSNLTQAAVRKFGLDSGFVDYKVCAIDATWSGLLFARRKNRSGPRA